MGFHDKYTTKVLKLKNPVKEADKIELSDDSYAQCELFEVLVNTLRMK